MQRFVQVGSGSSMTSRPHSSTHGVGSAARRCIFTRAASHVVGSPHEGHGAVYGSGLDTTSRGMIRAPSPLRQAHTSGVAAPRKAARHRLTPRSYDWFRNRGPGSARRSADRTTRRRRWRLGQQVRGVSAQRLDRVPHRVHHSDASPRGSGPKLKVLRPVVIADSVEVMHGLARH
jgi:hypothetical protein